MNLPEEEEECGLRTSTRAALLSEIESHRLELTKEEEPGLAALRREIEHLPADASSSKEEVPRLTSFDSASSEGSSSSSSSSKEEDDEDTGIENWPEWLVDEVYEVTKINNVRENLHNRPQRRLVALRRDGFRHLKPRGRKKEAVLRKFHPYRDVAATYLLSATRVCLAFFNDNDYIYETPMAAQLAQQIVARREAARALHRQFISRTMTIKKQGPGSKKKAWSSSTTNLSFGRDDDAMTPPKKKKNTNILLTTPLDLSGSSRSSDSTESSEKRDGNRLRIALTRFIMDSNEGRAIASFVVNQQKSKKFHFMLSATSRKTWAEAGSSIRTFLDGVFDYIWANREAELWKIFSELKQQHSEEKNNHNHVAAANRNDTLQDAVAQVLEACVLSPLLPPLIKDLRDPAAEIRLYESRQRLRPVKPIHLGVPAALADCLWTRAIFALSTLDDKSLPFDKLATLTATARAIHEEHKKLLDAFTIVASRQCCIPDSSDQYDNTVTMTTSKKLKKPPSCLAADDFLPIFIFVFIQAELHAPLQARTLLWALANPKHLRGEPGYFLTMFDAAIEYVQSGSAWADAVQQNPDLLLDDDEYDNNTVHSSHPRKYTFTSSSSITTRMSSIDSASSASSSRGGKSRNLHHPRPSSNDQISL